MAASGERHRLAALLLATLLLAGCARAAPREGGGPGRRQAPAAGA